jgi:ribosomal protein S18 acetylase RimI-like enzyme
MNDLRSRMRPGRPADLAGLIDLWVRDVSAGRRDSVPHEPRRKAMIAKIDWSARSRVVEGDGGGLAAAVIVTSRPTPEGVLALVDVAGPAGITIELAAWALRLSRDAGAKAAEVFAVPGQGVGLRRLGMKMVRPWWRMDRSLNGALPDARLVAGYELLDATAVGEGTWAEMHNRSFADHWRFSPRTEAELLAGKDPRLCLLAVTAAGRAPAAVTLGQVDTYPDDPRPQPVGLVSSVGTVPEHRRKGLANWLVAEVLARLKAAGARHASLYVDGWNETRAFDAYRNLGFELAFETEVWEATFP